MSDQSLSPAAAATPPRAIEPQGVVACAGPVREYVGDLAAELAQMARGVGDDALATALEAAANLAVRPMSGSIALARRRP